MGALRKQIKAAHWAGAPAPIKPQANGWVDFTPGYEGAAVGRRTVGWNPGNDSVNTALFGAGDTLRARSRDAVRKNAWAFNASEVLAAEAIGTGIKPQSQHSDAVAKDALQKLWTAWTDICDSYGTSDFYGLQALATRSMIDGGECFVRFRYRRPSDNLQVPLQLQLLEAEHCPSWKNLILANGNLVKQGIEFNKIGQRVAYWLYPVHPGENGIFGLFQDQQLEPVRVPANQVLHLFRPIRPGQMRGEPWLSRALIRLYDYDQYTDAELMRKKTAALFAAFVTENSDTDPLPGNLSSVLPGENGGAITAPAGLSFAGLEPGTIQKLYPGEDVKFSTPADVGANFEQFNRSALREIAAAIGVTYEQLTGDLSGVNYSSIRAGLLGFRRKCEMIQHSVIVHQFCRPIWQAFLESAVFAGEIKARDYKRNQAEYQRVKWIAPGWTWVDPAKELQAAKDAVRGGFKSLTQAISETGYDVEDVFRERAQENKLADELKLILDTDPRQTSTAGMRPAGRDPQNPDGLQDPEVDPVLPTNSPDTQGT
jgi:lambda family phage portal protein